LAANFWDKTLGPYRNPRTILGVMLSNAKHLQFSGCYEARFFGGVYPEHVEGPQNDIATQRAPQQWCFWINAKRTSPWLSSLKAV
jgi:hypothetical protein